MFGSVARSEEHPESDIDLLVRPSTTNRIVDLAGFMVGAEELPGTKTDVVSDRGTGQIMDRIRAEATPLWTPTTTSGGSRGPS